MYYKHHRHSLIDTDRPSVSVTDSMCLPQTVCVYSILFYILHTPSRQYISTWAHDMNAVLFLHQPPADSLCLSLTYCVRHIWPVSCIDIMCHRHSQTFIDFHWKSVSVTDSLCRSQIICFCHWQSVSVAYSLFLSQTVFVCHWQSVSVTNNLCLSLTVCVCHWQSVSVTNNLCLSLTVCVCCIQSISVTESLCLSLTVCVCHRQYVSVSKTLFDCSW